MHTPCDDPYEYIGEDGKMHIKYICPYSDEPTSEMCWRCQEPEEEVEYE